MQKIVWLSDIHLNFLNAKKINQFLNRVDASSFDSIWISGDIGQSKTVIEYLKLIDSLISCPIFFVLGNHDYYEGSVMILRDSIRDLCLSSKKLYWLNDCETVEISSDIGLIGHDSWADGRLGDYMHSDLIMNDYLLISEFNPLIYSKGKSIQTYPAGIRNIYNFFLSDKAKQKRLSVMQSLASEAYNHIEAILPVALEKYKHVYFITHVPPFKEACWHQGKISDDYGLPHFSCKIVGDLLVQIMNEHSDRHLTVLCGHTHSYAEVQILENLTVFAAQAEYGNPIIQKVIKFK